jgi:hypothetical protein
VGRFVCHFIPIYSSWLDLEERWFGEITSKRIRQESWEGMPQLVDAIKRYIAKWNKS